MNFGEMHCKLLHRDTCGRENSSSFRTEQSEVRNLLIAIRKVCSGFGSSLTTLEMTNHLWLIVLDSMTIATNRNTPILVPGNSFNKNHCCNYFNSAVITALFNAGNVCSIFTAIFRTGSIQRIVLSLGFSGFTVLSFQTSASL